jgi:hypothetical protein
MASRQMQGKEHIMARYLIESPHTPQECLQALDEVLAQGSEMLARYQWGCAAGEHTGWAIVEAGSKEEALRMVPALVRSKARIVALNTFTPEQIRSFHQQ